VVVHFEADRVLLPAASACVFESSATQFLHLHDFMASLCFFEFMYIERGRASSFLWDSSGFSQELNDAY
jgi:hypothetical protein